MLKISTKTRNALISQSPVNQMQKWQACLAAPDIFDQNVRRAIGAGVSGNVGGDGDARMRPERVILGQGFDPEYVKCGVANLAGRQCRQQGGIVNQRTTAGVKNNRAAFQP